MPEQLPEIPPENRGIKGDSKPKAKFLKDVYDVSIIGGDARDALWKKVLPGEKPPKKPHHPADDKAAEWMRQEKARAEERAERKWRNKFKEWQTDLKNEMINSPAANKNRLKREKSPEKPEKEAGSSPADPVAGAEPEPAQVKSSDSWRERAEVAETELASLRRESEGFLELQEELDRVYEEFRKAGQDLKQERERSRALQRHAQTLVQERDSWQARATQREAQLRQALEVRQVLATRIAKLSTRFEHLDAGLNQSAAHFGEGGETSGYVQAEQEPLAKQTFTKPEEDVSFKGYPQAEQEAYPQAEQEVAQALLEDASRGAKDPYPDEGEGHAEGEDSYGAEEDAHAEDSYAQDEAEGEDDGDEP